MIRKLKAIKAPVCGVFAATLTTPDIPFCMVKSMAHEESGSRARWKGPMTMQALSSLVGRLGVKFKRINPGVGTLHNIAKTLDPKAHHIVMVTNHFLTLYDGKCYDQSYPDGVPVESFWCSGRNVLDALEIDRTH